MLLPLVVKNVTNNPAKKSNTLISQYAHSKVSVRSMWKCFAHICFYGTTTMIVQYERNRIYFCPYSVPSTHISAERKCLRSTLGALVCMCSVLCTALSSVCFFLLFFLWHFFCMPMTTT